MDKRPASLTQQVSSGGVIYHGNPVGTQICLVSVREGRIWCLPKGLIDKGETPEEAAVREVREESGLSGRIVERLGDITYWYYIPGRNVKCRKTVHFYLMEYLSGSTDQHDSEVDEARWVSMKEALEMISFRGDRAILEKARSRLRELGIEK